VQRCASATCIDSAAELRLIGMSEKGKAMSKAERGELARRIAQESGDAIAKATKKGLFVLPLMNSVASRRLTTTSKYGRRPSALIMKVRIRTPRYALG
jgi:hypothetical protein